MAECVRLESGYTARYRGFDSRPFRLAENIFSGESKYTLTGIASSNLAPSAFASLKLGFGGRSPPQEEERKRATKLFLCITFIH